MIFHLGY